MSELRIYNLAVAGGTVDFKLTRHEDDVGLDVFRREGGIRILLER